MANFVKIGVRYVNLDRVIQVAVGGAAYPRVEVHFDLTYQGSTLVLLDDEATLLTSWLDRTAIDLAAAEGAPAAPESSPAAELLADVKAALRAPGGPLPKLEAVRAAVARARGEGRERRDE